MSDIRKYFYSFNTDDWTDASGNKLHVNSMEPVVRFTDHAAEVARLTAELDAGIEAGWHALRDERDALKARVEGLKGRVEGLEGALRELQQRREKDLNTEDKK